MRREFPEHQVHDPGGGVVYVPFVSDDGRVGYRVVTGTTEPAFLYFNPSVNTEEEPDDANVFVYTGFSGNPVADYACTYFHGHPDRIRTWLGG